MDIKSNVVYSNEIFTSLIQLGDSFANVEFNNCVLNLCDFSESKFTNCIFEKCKIENSNLSNCKFEGCRLIESRFEKTKMIGIDWTGFASNLGLRLDCELCDLSYGVFIGQDISESRFINCKMQEMDLSEGIAKKVIFTKSDLLKTIFYKTNLKEADFVKATNYIFDPSINYCKGAKFSKNEVTNLLLPYGIEMVEE